MTVLRMPWRILVVVALVGAVGGAAFGFVRGLSNLPTLPVAIVEGGILFGVPAALLGLGVTAAWGLGGAVRRGGTRERPAVATATSGQHKPASRSVCIAAEAISAGVIIVAAATLPWARYEVPGVSAVVSLHAGPFTLPLLVIGVIGVALATAQARWRAGALAWSEIIAGTAALVLSVVTAASRISHANTVTDTSGGGTAFGIGSALAVLAALVLMAAAVTLVVLDSATRSGQDY